MGAPGFQPATSCLRGQIGPSQQYRVIAGQTASTGMRGTDGYSGSSDRFA